MIRDVRICLSSLFISVPLFLPFSACGQQELEERVRVMNYRLAYAYVRIGSGRTAGNAYLRSPRRARDSAPWTGRKIERKNGEERGKLELADSRHAGYREAGRCPALAMRRTTCIVRQSSRRHVPVIAYSACNITKHHRGRTCKQRASPPTRGRHLSALSRRN